MNKTRSIVSAILIFSFLFPTWPRAQENNDADVQKAAAYLHEMSIDNQAALALITSSLATTMGTLYFLLKAGDFKPEAVNLIRTMSIRTRYWLMLEPNANRSLTAIFYEVNNRNPSTFFRDALSKHANISELDLGLFDLESFSNIKSNVAEFKKQLYLSRKVYRIYYDKHFENQFVSDSDRFHLLIKKSFGSTLTSSELKEFYSLEQKIAQITQLLSKQTHLHKNSLLSEQWKLAQKLDDEFSYTTEKKFLRITEEIRKFSGTNRNFNSLHYRLMGFGLEKSKTDRLFNILNESETLIIKESSEKLNKIKLSFRENLRYAKGMAVLTGLFVVCTLILVASDYADSPVLSETKIENMDPVQVYEELKKNPRDVDLLLELSHTQVKKISSSR